AAEAGAWGEGGAGHAAAAGAAGQTPGSSATGSTARGVAAGAGTTRSTSSSVSSNSSWTIVLPPDAGACDDGAGVGAGRATFSTIAFARKQCLPSLSKAVSRIGVSTGRGVAVRSKKRRVLSSGWRARTSSSVAQGSFTWSATPVFFEPPAFEGSLGTLPPTV